VSCHGWSGESPVSSMATLTGSWAVNDPGATNVAQIVISGTKRHVPEDRACRCPSFGNIYTRRGYRGGGQLCDRALRLKGIEAQRQRTSPSCASRRRSRFFYPQISFHQRQGRGHRH